MGPGTQEPRCGGCGLPISICNCPLEEDEDELEEDWGAGEADDE